MQSVTVLTTHGRRQAVKVENNKTVLSILEQVCAKFSFDASKYGLKHHNKLLDLSQMFRFAGIPNNATLEMTEVDNKRVEEQNLLICLQLEDGSRLEGNFSSSSMLRSIIKELCPLKSTNDQNPVLVYMRSMYHGDQLDSVSLRELGLSGRALLRLMNTDPENLKVQANISAPLPQKPKEETNEPRVVPQQKIPEKPTPAVTSINLSEIKRLKQEAEPKSIVEPMEIEEETSIEAPKHSEEFQEIKEIPTEQASTSELPTLVPEPIINYLDTIGTIIFSLDSLQKSSSDVPDSFFDLTEADVKKLYRDLKNDVEHDQNRPLMTSALRKLEEDKKILNLLAQYKSTAVRIQLPDRFVIQTKFSKVETVDSVMKFVRDFLANPNLEFHLFVTPPKTILSKEDTLVEAKLVPSALLHFGLDDPSAVDSQYSYLKPEFLDKISTGCSSSALLTKEKPEKDNLSPGTSSDFPTQHGNSSNSQLNFLPSKTKSSTASGAVPKWFKR